MRINVTRSSLPDFDEYIREIRDLWDSHWLTNMGDKHQQLEKALAEYFSVPQVTLFTNGHLALEAALAALHLPAGSEVITTPYTFVSTTHAIARNNLVPVFADIKEDDYTLDPDKVRSLITEKTAAILPVHVYGRLCDTEAFAALAKEHHLPLIYDAAHCFGVKKNGKSSAAFGDISMFSFHATKVFHTVEGGALAYHNEALRQPVLDQKNFGIQGPEEIAGIGGNAKMSELQAAMGLCNLRHIEEEISKRGRVTEHYLERLSGRSGIIIPAGQEGVTPNYAYFPVVFDGYKEDRDRILDKLCAEDIVPRKYFYPLTNDISSYRHLPTGGRESTPIAAHIADRVLTLPLYADLSLDDVDRICDIILR